MKKIVFLAAAALLALTGCVKDEIFQGPSTIEKVVFAPEAPTSLTPVDVTATVTGLQAVKTATLTYNGKDLAMSGSGATYKATIPALLYAVVLTIIMGLTRQTADGKWLNNMLSFWPFVLIYVYIAVILGQTILKRLFTFRFSLFSLKRDVPFLLNHLGLFLAMTTATLGNADVQRLKMIIVKGETEWRALDQKGLIIEMPIAIELKNFVMETYDDGSPKRFASDIKILTKTKKNIQTTVEVNKPVEVDGWKIYQYGYDTQMGAMSNISILELVSDPWLPLVYTGIYMMLGGAFCMFIFGGRRKHV